MIKVKFLDLQEFIDVEFEKVNEHIVQLNGTIPKNTSGFHTYRENKELLGDYQKFTTIYQILDGGVQFSNDGSTAPKAQDATPYTPTLEEVKANKIEELSAICEQKIINEFLSCAFDGVTQLPYDCKITDQSRINGLVSLAQLRLSNLVTEEIKWKNANQDICEVWTPEQMLALGLDLKRHMEVKTARYDNLKVYMNSLTTIDEVKAVTWDTTIK
ncbi:DUF4376 domain-containing protein [Anaerosacchariphilus polymeriproducens]|uniref:DUF4376 domain-containing protein n=1 Tax=Anaerosacchariphilus polymeriproducens TaxID=1812858 RepID=A0A371ARL9_9FIRM|nr:hypothetical protein [Anaerosacchariphilus polymeriproducens]RDU22217.1 hypothetical protein DWV06_16970 [Anaerosacchariphilus polymeriproducens]